MEPKKSLQELTLLDRFLFDEAMEKPENMQAVLEIILLLKHARYGRGKHLSGAERAAGFHGTHE